MRAGIGFVPEDRRQQGLVMDLSIARNTALTRLGKLSKGGLIRSAAENALASEWGTKLQLKFHRLDDPVGTLSGGNQQKVVLAKWLATEPKLLIVDEPTRGIDVGTKAEVHRLLSELAGQGVAVLMISSELPEVLGMADRVLVMHEGRLTAELSRDEADEERVIRAATGQLAVRAACRPRSTFVPGQHAERGREHRARLEGARARRMTEWVFRVRELGIFAVLVLLIVVTGILEPRFLETGSLRNLALNASIFAILAAGQTLVLITRNVDLSVGSVLGLSAYLAGDLLSNNQSLPLPLVFLAGMALGAVCGALNGVLVTLGQVPALVVTLGTLYMFRGIAFLWTNGTQVNAETLPDAFLNLGTDSILGVPILVIFALVVLVVVGQWLRDYRAGRELYAIGSNPDGARLAGVRSDRRVLSAFVLAGALAGLGGVLFTARFGTVDATAGVGYELTVDRRGRRRRRRDLRRHRQRLRRRAGRAAAGHDHVLADRPAGRGVLAAGRDRRAAADRDHLRPARSRLRVDAALRRRSARRAG